MKKLSVSHIKSMPADKLSGYVLVVLIALAVLLFGAFYLFGYNNPYEEDANFNAPLFTDALMVFVYVLGTVAVVVAVVSIVRSVKQHSVGDYESNGVPAAKIVYSTVALLVVSMILTFAFGSSEPLDVNGVKFTETALLKMTDMFINTSIILGVVAVAAVVFGMSGYNRKLNKKG